VIKIPMTQMRTNRKIAYVYPRNIITSHQSVECVEGHVLEGQREDDFVHGGGEGEHK